MGPLKFFNWKKKREYERRKMDGYAASMLESSLISSLFCLSL